MLPFKANGRTLDCWSSWLALLRKFEVFIPWWLENRVSGLARFGLFRGEGSSRAGLDTFVCLFVLCGP